MTRRIDAKTTSDQRKESVKRLSSQTQPPSECIMTWSIHPVTTLRWIDLNEIGLWTMGGFLTKARNASQQNHEMARMGRLI